LPAGLWNLFILPSLFKKINYEPGRIWYIAVGFMILFANKFGLRNEFAESTPGKIFAGLFFLYGIWRVYRGIKKDYLKDQ
jgi:hypothetical protein